MGMYAQNHRTLIPIIFYLRHQLRTYVQKSSKHATTTFENIDAFTTQLSEQKAQKWDKINTKIFQLFKCVHQSIHNEYNEKIDQITDAQIQTYVAKLIENRDQIKIKEVVNYCFEKNIILDRKVLVALTSLCAHYGDKDNVIKLIKLGKNTGIIGDNDLVWKQYLAEALWISGNVQDSIGVLRELYVQSQLRSNISLLLRFLISQTIEQRTEAVLVQIKEFVEDISVKYNEMMPLTYLWECCLLSVWFCDQTTALELLEKNNKLRDYLAPKYPYVIAKALKNNQIDIVQRLLQLFLTHKMERQYISLLQQLFDYHYCRRDYRFCAEILRWCSDLKIPLQKEHNAKFVDVLLNQYCSRDQKPLMSISDTPRSRVQFKLKF